MHSGQPMRYLRIGGPSWPASLLVVERSVGLGCPSPEAVVVPVVVVVGGGFFMVGRNPRALPFFFFFVMTKR